MKKTTNFIPKYLIAVAVLLLTWQLISQPVWAAWPQVLLVEDNWLKFDFAARLPDDPDPSDPDPDPYQPGQMPDVNLVISNGLITGRSISVNNDFTNENWRAVGNATATPDLITATAPLSLPTATLSTTAITWELTPQQQDFWQLTFDYQFTTEAAELLGFGEPALRVLMCGETAWSLPIELADESWYQATVSRGTCGDNLPEKITWELIGDPAALAAVQLKLASVNLDTVTVSAGDLVQLVSDPTAVLSYDYNFLSAVEGESPLTIPTDILTEIGDLSVSILDSEQNFTTVKNFSLNKSITVPSKPIIYSVQREPNSQLTLETFFIGTDRRAYELFDLRIAALATDLESNFDQLPRVALAQSQLLNHYGTWAPAISGQVSLLVTEIIADDVFFLGLKTRDQTWQSSNLSTIWRCEANLCQAYLPPYKRITPNIQAAPTDQNKLYLTLYNSGTEDIDLANWELWTGQEYLLSISQLNTNSLHFPTDWGETNLRSWDTLITELELPDAQSGSLILYDHLGKAMMNIHYQCQSNDFDNDCQAQFNYI